jgi:dolichol-phosphate mannosyltransferase
VYKNQKIIALVPAYNEVGKIEHVVRRTPRDVVDCLLVIDDGSTDETAHVSRDGGAEVLSLGSVQGVGAALRAGLKYGRANGFDIAVIMAGNNKDNPSEIPNLLDPICDAAHDIVMGSRFLKGGGYGGDMPLYRKFATRLHPWLMSVITRKSLSETTNGFRAVRLSCLEDCRIDLDQQWLNGYGLEIYMLYKMIVCGYRHAEVPCTKIYPPRRLGNTKMRPIIGWWDMLRPVVLLGLGLRQ